MSVVTGTVAFANLVEHEVFNGTSTGKYSIVLVLDDDSVEKLAAEGVKLKEYKNQKQRKFATKQDFEVVDADGNAIPKGEVSWGDKVKVKYFAATKNPHPVWGTSVYLDAVKLIEKGEREDVDDEF